MTIREWIFVAVIVGLCLIEYTLGFSRGYLKGLEKADEQWKNFARGRYAEKGGVENA